MSEAIQINPAYFKGKYPIEAYGAGGFRFAEISHKGGLLCAPSGFYSVNLLNPIIETSNLLQIIELQEKLELLLIGTGSRTENLTTKAHSLLTKHNIIFDIMNTGAAIRTYNILLSEGRAVAALLYPV